MQQWKRTRVALEKLEDLLLCKICHRLVNEPCSLEACDHCFCRQCVEDVIGVNNKCPECGSFAWVKDLKPNRQLTNLVSLCKTMRCTIETSRNASEQQCSNDQNVVIDVNQKSERICEKRLTKKISNNCLRSDGLFPQNESTGLSTNTEINGVNNKSSEIQNGDDSDQLENLNSYEKSSFCNNISQGIVIPQTNFYSHDTSRLNIHGNKVCGQLCEDDDNRERKCYMSNYDSHQETSCNQFKIGDNSSSSRNDSNDNDSKNETFNCQTGRVDSDETNDPLYDKQINGSFESTSSQETYQNTPNSSFDLFDSFNFSHCSENKDTEFRDLSFSEDTSQSRNITYLGKSCKEGDEKSKAEKKVACSKCNLLESQSCALDKNACTCTQDSTKTATKGQKRKLSGQNYIIIQNNQKSSNTLQVHRIGNSSELDSAYNEVKIKKIKEGNDYQKLKEIPCRSLSTPIRKKIAHLNSENGTKSTGSPISRLVLSPAELTKKNKRGEGLLHVAAIKGNIEDVKCLLEKGANPNDKDNAGWSPLHEASNHGHTTIAKMLLDYGAIIDLPGGQDHDTPLHDAVANGRVEMARLLVQHGAPLSVRNKQGLTPIDCAITEEMRSVLQSPETPSGKSLVARKTVRCLQMIHQETPKVILCSGLKPDQKVALEKCIGLNGGKCLTEFSPEVTHLVTATNDTDHCARTIKYLQALLSGKWIVSFKWITKCLSVKSWVDESPYEVKGTSRAKEGVPRYSRINTEKQLPGLFDGCQFYFNGILDSRTPQKDTLMQLVRYGGGKVLTREPKSDTNYELFLPRKDNRRIPLADLPVVAYHAKPESAQYRCTRYIVYDPLTQSKPIYRYDGLSVVPVSWLLDCISNFEIMDIPP